MASEDEQIRLVLQTKGVDSIKDLQDKLSATRQELADLIIGYQKTGGSQDAYDAEVKRLTADLSALNAANAKVTASLGQAGSKMAGLGQAGLQTGRVIQDFTQGGIGGILNNIEGLSMALGGGPGLAGILTALGIGFYIFKPQIEAFLESFNSTIPDRFTDSLEGVQERIKELTKEPISLAVEMRELNNLEIRLKELKAARAAIDLIGQGKTVNEKEAGEEFKKQFGETGQQGIAAYDAIVRRMTDKLIKQSPTIAAVDKQRAVSDEIIRKSEAAMASGAAGPGATQGLMEAIATAKADVKKAESAAALEREKIILKEAPQKVGELFAPVQAGTATPLERAQLERLVRGLGGNVLGNIVRDTSPKEVGILRTVDEAIAKMAAGVVVSQAKELADKKKEENQAVTDQNKRESQIATAFGTKFADDLKAKLLASFAQGDSAADAGAALTDWVRTQLGQANIKGATPEILEGATKKIVGDKPEATYSDLAVGGDAQIEAARQLSVAADKLKDVADRADRKEIKAGTLEAQRDLAGRIEQQDVGVVGGQFSPAQAMAAAKQAMALQARTGMTQQDAVLQVMWQMTDAIIAQNVRAMGGNAAMVQMQQRLQRAQVHNQTLLDQ